MKEIFKKNIVLLIVLIVTILASISLLTMVVLTDTKRRESDQKITELKKEINDISSKKPAPTVENLTDIKNDIVIVKKRTQDLLKLFSKPYRKAFEKIIESLETNEQKFLNEWKLYIQNNAKKENTLVQSMDEFLTKNYTDEKLTAALKTFINTINQKQLVKIKERTDSENEAFLTENISEIILEYLGYPRKMTPEDCVDYISKLQKSIYSLLENNHISIPASWINNKMVLFNEYDRVPTQEQTFHIQRHCHLYDDLFNRIVESKIQSIELFQKKNSIEGDRIDNYLFLKYDLHFTGTMESIRNLINSMQEAAIKDYRVYVIKSISLSKLFDEVNELMKIKDTSQSRVQIRDENKEIKSKESILDDAKILKLINKLREKNIKPEEKSDEDLKRIISDINRKGYLFDFENANILLNPNDVTIGKKDFNIVKCNIEFDYIIYIGDEIKSK